MNDNNKNTRDRVIYYFLFIIIIIGVTIMYATLASNFATKINKSNDKPTDNPITDKGDDTPSSNSSSNYSRRSSDQTVPVIVPDNINWLVEFDNIVIDDDSMDAITDAYILDTKTEIIYKLLLKEPGDTYGFTVDIVNKGNVDAKIYDIVDSKLTEREKQYLDYSVTYENGDTIKIDDPLLVGEKKKIKLSLKYKDDLEASDLPSEDKELDLTYQLIYIEK